MPEPSQPFILTQLPAEPRSHGTSWSTNDLPEEVLASAMGRVRIAALISATLWGLALTFNVALATWWPGFLPEDTGWPTPNWIYALIGVVGSLALASSIERFKARPRKLLDLGLGLEVFTAALIGLITHYTVSYDPSKISWIAAVILVYPAIAPAAPRKILAAGLVAASMDGLAVGVAALRGEPLGASGLKLVGRLAWELIPNYVCAFLALVPATLIRRLGRAAGVARELGSYRLGRLLQRGGMGEVYEATHRMIAKPAAIKLIRPELLADSPAFAEMIVERFYREAEAVAALKSPHTVALYDFGVAADGTLYYVMELLEGIDLQRLVERFGPLPPERVAHILCQVCDSLGEAHGRGMVHRDIKPSNIVLCHLGLTADFVKVLDFGLVRREVQTQAGTEGLSAPMGHPGTPSYMAPEMVSGSGSIDRRADLYALGCVGYWLLTGHTVFEGASPIQVMYHHGYDAPVPPSARLGAPLPGDLEALILETLAKIPDDRPQTAEAFGQRVAACELAGSWDSAHARTWWSRNLETIRASRA